MEKFKEFLTNKKIAVVLLGVIIVMAFTVRLYKFQSPIADWHSWRQADTSAVSRWYIQHGIDLLHPRFEDISNIPSGHENPMGYRMVEFPIYNAVTASAFLFFKHFTLEEWGRLVTIFAQLLSIIFLFLIVKRHVGAVPALFTAFFFGFLPYNIYYGRTILPDPSMVMTSLGGIYFFDKWIASSFDSERGKYTYAYLILSLIFTAAAFLLKPYALIFTLPMVLLAVYQFKFSLLKRFDLIIYALVSVIPLILWRQWILQFPSGIPVSDWLFNGGNIRFKGAFFYWLFADRIGRLIMGYWGVTILSFGILSKVVNQTKEKSTSSSLFFASFLVSSLLYLFIIARGNVQHDYYQILIIPTIAIYLGLGAAFLLQLPKAFFNQSIGIIFLFITTAFTLFFGWYFIRDYYNINNPAMVVAGQAVDRLTPKNAKVIANLEGDTSFLYQTGRQGWPSFEKGPEDLAKMGAGYMVLLNPNPHDLAYKSEFKVVDETSQYIIYNLNQKP